MCQHLLAEMVSFKDPLTLNTAPGKNILLYSQKQQARRDMKYISIYVHTSREAKETVFAHRTLNLNILPVRNKDFPTKLWFKIVVYQEND